MSSGTLNLAPITRQLDEIQSAMATRSDVDQVSSMVTEVSGTLRSTQDQLAELQRQFAEYVQQARRTAAVQRAETKLGTLKADLEREYGHYKVVRRSSIGLLQAFDIGNVSESTAGQVSEELMIQTPRYWLAPALVALAAWSRDDEDVAKRSVAEAYGRNQAKTALFFALVLRREHRDAESVRWLRHYFASCDPHNLTREFAVILEAASQGQFGPPGTDLVRTQLHTWTKELRTSQDLVKEQVNKWVQELTVAREVLDNQEAQMLRRLTPPASFAAVKAQTEAATALGRCAEKYEAVKDSDFTSAGMISSLLDDLLIQLVTEYDDEELPLRREVTYQEAIIDSDGDADRARAKADQLIAILGERTDAVTLQTNAAIAPDSLGVSVRTQQVAIGAGLPVGLGDGVGGRVVLDDGALDAHPVVDVGLAEVAPREEPDEDPAHAVGVGPLDPGDELGPVGGVLSHVEVADGLHDLRRAGQRSAGPLVGSDRGGRERLCGHRLGGGHRVGGGALPRHGCAAQDTTSLVLHGDRPRL